MKFDFSLIKKHPYISGGVILIGGVAFWYFFLRGSSQAVTITGSGVDPTVQAQLGASQQEQSAQIAYQLAAQLQNDQTNLAALSQQLQVKANEDAYNYELGMKQLDSQTKIALQTLSNQTDITKATLDEKLSEDKLAAALQQNLATINAQLQYNVSALQSQNFQAQLNQQMEINGQNDNVIMNGQIQQGKTERNGQWAQTVGMLALAFL